MDSTQLVWMAGAVANTHLCVNSLNFCIIALTLALAPLSPGGNEHTEELKT